MIRQNPAQIFKSDLRTITKSDLVMAVSTLNYEEKLNSKPKTFGSLKLFTEIILAPSGKKFTYLDTDTDIFLLPLFGGIDYLDNLGDKDFIRVDQIKHISAQKGMTIEISNTYEENVSYLEIWFTPKSFHYNSNAHPFQFDLSERNKLYSLFSLTNAKGFIGLYDGRREGNYQLKKHLNGVFVFVVNGAFEVENRLLEAKDGLSLTNTGIIEWEALSENALLIVLEIPAENF
ncbi:hypothetical protein [Flavobacterium adhaerens]|uniref:pirin family protein n=1 Tax=Flavobacterium adhaerens TaxID=3149043 RepID=UPI0032B351FF